MTSVQWHEYEGQIRFVGLLENIDVSALNGRRLDEARQKFVHGPRCDSQKYVAYLALHAFEDHAGSIFGFSQRLVLGNFLGQRYFTSRLVYRLLQTFVVQDLKKNIRLSIFFIRSYAERIRYLQFD